MFSIQPECGEPACWIFQSYGAHCDTLVPPARGSTVPWFASSLSTVPVRRPGHSYFPFSGIPLSSKCRPMPIREQIPRDRQSVNLDHFFSSPHRAFRPPPRFRLIPTRVAGDRRPGANAPFSGSCICAGRLLSFLAQPEKFKFSQREENPFRQPNSRMVRAGPASLHPLHTDSGSLYRRKPVPFRLVAA